MNIPRPISAAFVALTTAALVVTSAFAAVPEQTADSPQSADVAQSVDLPQSAPEDTAAPEPEPQASAPERASAAPALADIDEPAPTSGPARAGGVTTTVGELDYELDEGDTPCHEPGHRGAAWVKGFSASGDAENVVVPESINYQGELYCVDTVLMEAFKGDRAKSLKSIQLPQQMHTIGFAAFQNATGLHTVRFLEIPTPHTWKLDISGDAFRGTGLTSLHLPGTTRNILDGAFADTKSLGAVTFGIPAKTGVIGTAAFMGSSLTSIEMPGSVTEIGAQAFEATPNLRTVSFNQPSSNSPSLTTIRTGAFKESGLRELTIPATVNKIASSAFQRAADLTRLNFLGTRAPNMGTDALADTPKLTVWVPNGAKSDYEATLTGKNEPAGGIKQMGIDAIITGVRTEVWKNNGWHSHYGTVHEDIKGISLDLPVDAELSAVKLHFTVDYGFVIGIGQGEDDRVDVSDPQTVSLKANDGDPIEYTLAAREYSLDFGEAVVADGAGVYGRVGAEVKSRVPVKNNGLRKFSYGFSPVGHAGSVPASTGSFDPGTTGYLNGTYKVTADDVSKPYIAVPFEIFSYEDEEYVPYATTNPVTFTRGTVSITVGSPQPTDGGTYFRAGQPVGFTIPVTNTGTAEAEVRARYGASGPDAAPVLIKAGATADVPAVYTTTEGDLSGDVQLGIVFQVHGDGLTPVSAQPTAISRITPPIDLTATAGTQTYSAIGDEVEFTYAVTNRSGQSFPVVLRGLGCGADGTTVTLTEAATPQAFTCTHEITRADLVADSIVSTPILEVPGNPITVDSDPATVTVNKTKVRGLTVTDAEFTVTDQPSFVGQKLPLSITVSNTGNVTETVKAGTAMGYSGESSFTLAPGEQETVTATMVVTAADLGLPSTVRIVAASTEASGPMDDSTLLAITPTAPPVTVAAAVDGGAADSYERPGEVVALTYTVENTWDQPIVLTLRGAGIAEAGKSITVPAAKNGSTPGSLEVPASYAVTVADVESGSFDATASVAAASNTRVVRADAVTVTRRDVRTFELQSVTPDAQDVFVPGQVVTAEAKVKNTGNVPLLIEAGVDGTRQGEPVEIVPDFATQGDSTHVFTVSRTVIAEDLADESDRPAHDAFAGIVGEPASRETTSLGLTAVAPPVTVAVAIDGGSAERYERPGDKVGLTYTVENTWNQPISLTLHGTGIAASGESITVPARTNVATPGHLEVPAFYAVTVADVESGSFEAKGQVAAASNSRTVGADPVKVTRHDVRTFELHSVTPAARPVFVPGQVATAEVEVRNTGNVSLKVEAGVNGTVQGGPAQIVPDFATMGDSTHVFTVSYTVTDQDLNGESDFLAHYAFAGIVEDPASREKTSLGLMADAPPVSFEPVEIVGLDSRDGKAAEYSRVGDRLEITYTVRNAATMELEATMDALGIDPVERFTLPPMKDNEPSETEIVRTYAITAEDVDAGMLTAAPTATVIGNPRPTAPDEDSEAHANRVDIRSLEITGVEWERETYYFEGQRISATVTAANTGNVPLEVQVGVAGSFTDAEQTIGWDPDGEGGNTAEFTATYTVTKQDIEAATDGIDPVFVVRENAGEGEARAERAAHLDHLMPVEAAIEVKASHFEKAGETVPVTVTVDSAESRYGIDGTVSLDGHAAAQPITLDGTGTRTVTVDYTTTDADVRAGRADIAAVLDAAVIETRGRVGTQAGDRRIHVQSDPVSLVHRAPTPGPTPGPTPAPTPAPDPARPSNGSAANKRTTAATGADIAGASALALLLLAGGTAALRSQRRAD